MVRLSLLGAAAAVASTAFASPLAPHGEKVKRASLDVDILQFALTLEHLENVFYKNAIQKFSVQDFEQAGFSADFYRDLHFIAYDEQTHVVALEAALKALGQKPVAACTYEFPYTTVKSFITLSSVIENVGTSAYLGAAPLITGADYLTVAGAILAVEAIHTSLQRAAIGEVPMANPFETPLDGNSVYTLASMFITSCPASNFKLPFKAFPYLATDGATCSCEQPACGAPSNYIKKRSESSWHWPGPGGWHPQSSCKPPSVGAPATFTADASSIPAGSYLTFVNGLTVASVKGTVKGNEITADIPAGVSGQTYVFVTKKAETTFADSAVLFGPAILEVNPAPPALDFSIRKE